MELLEIIQTSNVKTTQVMTPSYINMLVNVSDKFSNLVFCKGTVSSVIKQMLLKHLELPGTSPST